MGRRGAREREGAVGGAEVEGERFKQGDNADLSGGGIVELRMREDEHCYFIDSSIVR